MSSAAAVVTSPFKENTLQDRVVLISGGSSGIGLEIARTVLRHGAKGCVIMGRRQNFLDSACGELNSLPGSQGGLAVGVQGDVRKPESCRAAVQAAVDRFGSVDILVNSAAGNFLATAEELRPKGFRTVMEIDTLGTFNMCSELGFRVRWGGGEESGPWL